MNTDTDTTTDHFKKCLGIILKFEGGFSDNPNDPGGPTNYGITLETFRHFYGESRDVEDLKNMHHWQLRHIYRAGYWDKVSASRLPAGVDLVAFDGAVHSGYAQSAKWLQRAVFAKEDGIVGPKTLARVESRDSLRVITDVLSFRMDFLQGLRHSDQFPGWQVRVVNIFNESLKLVDEVKS